MGGFGDFSKKEKRKRKQSEKSGQTSYSSAPVFVPPTIVPKVRKDK